MSGRLFKVVGIGLAGTAAVVLAVGPAFACGVSYSYSSYSYPSYSYYRAPIYLPPVKKIISPIIVKYEAVVPLVVAPTYSAQFVPAAAPAVAPGPTLPPPRPRAPPPPPVAAPSVMAPAPVPCAEINKALLAAIQGLRADMAASAALRAPAPSAYAAPMPPPSYSAPAPPPAYSAPPVPPSYSAPSAPPSYSAPPAPPSYSAPPAPYTAPPPRPPTPYTAPPPSPRCYPPTPPYHPPTPPPSPPPAPVKPPVVPAEEEKDEAPRTIQPGVGGPKGVTPAERNALNAAQARCARCHARGKEGKGGGFSLLEEDAFGTRFAALDQLDWGTVVRRVASERRPMPPADSGITLDPIEREAILSWARLGAGLSRGHSATVVRTREGVR